MLQDIHGVKRNFYGDKSTLKTEDPPVTSEPITSSTEPSISQTPTSAESSSNSDNAVQDFCETDVKLSFIIDDIEEEDHVIQKDVVSEAGNEYPLNEAILNEVSISRGREDFERSISRNKKIGSDLYETIIEKLENTVDGNIYYRKTCQVMTYLWHQILYAHFISFETEADSDDILSYDEDEDSEDDNTEMGL
ncbi:hypothetical protein WA026_018697 [Henosepilachna vigintioctopunctata]|uniref:Uncharacterized protein n=1 Tax=Henosepilachna vigintioctopunctata TaxID=420089 RepID=A0AAW1TM46_9CUCU